MKQDIIAAQIDTEFITAQAEKWTAAADAAQKAADAYNADLSTRRAALAQQATGYQTEIAKLNAARKALAAKINDLSSRGMIDEAAEVDTELEALDKSITALERKLRLVSTAELKGDPKLYSAAKAAHGAAEAERTPYRESIATLQQIVKLEIERLESVQRELGYAMNRDPGRFATNAFEKVDRHYRDLDRLEREAAEKAAAERVAAGNKRTVKCFTGEAAPLSKADPEVVAARKKMEEEAKARKEAITKQNQAANDSKTGERHYVLA